MQVRVEAAGPLPAGAHTKALRGAVALVHVESFSRVCAAPHVMTLGYYEFITTGYSIIKHASFYNNHTIL